MVSLSHSCQREQRIRQRIETNSEGREENIGKASYFVRCKSNLNINEEGKEEQS